LSQGIAARNLKNHVITTVPSHRNPDLELSLIPSRNAGSELIKPTRILFQALNL